MKERYELAISVSYQRLFSFGKYENERIGFSREIKENENADAVIGELYLKVCDIEDVLQTYRDLLHNIEYLTQQVNSDQHNVHRTENEINDMKVKISEIEALLKSGKSEIDERLRHACDRRTLKTLQDNLVHNKQRLKQHRTELAKAIKQKNLLKQRIKEGNFSLDGFEIEKIRHYPRDYY